MDELDRLKRSSQGGDAGGKVRNRARQAPRSLEQTAETGDTVYPQETGTVEVVMYPEHHVRLPTPDDEIIDRAVAVHRVAGRPVHLVTNDTGMLLRARAAGLAAHRLETPKDNALVVDTDQHS